MLTISDCIEAVSQECRVPTDKLLGRDKSRWLARPRQLAMWLARQTTGSSLPVIASAFLKDDHTTVLHACRVIERLRASDPKMRETSDRLHQRLMMAQAAE